MKLRITSGAKVDIMIRYQLCVPISECQHTDIFLIEAFQSCHLANSRTSASVAWSKSCFRANLILGCGCGRGPDVTSTNKPALQKRSRNQVPESFPMLARCQPSDFTIHLRILLFDFVIFAPKNGPKVIEAARTFQTFHLHGVREQPGNQYVRSPRLG